MRITRKISSLFLAFVMVLGLLPATTFATETEMLSLEELREQYGAITIEAYTLGRGFLVEPSLYAKEEGLCTAEITMDLLERKNIRYIGNETYIEGFEFDDTVTPEYPSYIDPEVWGLGDSGDGDGFLAEFDYGQYAGWVHTVDYWFASYGIDVTGPGVALNDYNTGEPMILGDVIRWHFTAAGYGADCGIPGNAMAEMMGDNLFTQEDKTDLIFILAAINDYYGNLDTDNVYETALAVAAAPLASADEIAAQEATLTTYIEDTFFAAAEPEEPREAQDVSGVLNATMAQLAATVTAPSFGTNAGEWTVFGLARGGYYAKDNAYFTDYYNRIVETVNTTAASVNMNGALSKNKPTENSRLILALSAIGKDSTSVGNWNLVTPYEDFDWIKKQGINSLVFALIALDSHNYTTTSTNEAGASIRQQCVDAILALQHNDGGWSLSPDTTLASNVDVTGMTLQALYPYRSQSEVAAACNVAFTWLSNEQLPNGGFPYGSDGATCESTAQVIVACTIWGINPDTDSRFIKNGNSAIDNLLTYYLENEAMFEHGRGAGANAMATDQATYALVAYDRFIKGKPALYDYSDVIFDKSESSTPETPDGSTPDSPESDEMTATLGLPAKINPGESFNATVSINNWDNEAGYKLLDMIVNVPSGVSVTGVTPGSKLTGGEVSWNLEEAAGKLRIVYFDANKNADLTMAGGYSSAELMTIKFATDEDLDVSQLKFSLGGMSLKKSSESTAEDSMAVVDTAYAKGTVTVVQGISFSAVCVYEGDDVDLIPSTKKAVAVAVTGLGEGIPALTYTDGTNNIEFKYSAEISEKTDIPAYVALVSASIAMENFANADNYELNEEETAADLTFGDSNGDGVINAQDALAAVDCWLRKTEATNDKILPLNVNGDSRLNTFDALGIVEAFVNGTEYGIVTKAATITTKQ